jgi:hypothetical protein
MSTNPNKIKESRSAKSVVKLTFLTVAAFFFLAPMPAFAYLDPGAGSYVIQFLLAGFAATGFFIRVFWQRIKSFFSKTPVEVVEDSDEEESV